MPRTLFQIIRCTDRKGIPSWIDVRNMFLCLSFCRDQCPILLFRFSVNLCLDAWPDLRQGKASSKSTLLMRGSTPYSCVGPCMRCAWLRLTQPLWMQKKDCIDIAHAQINSLMHLFETDSVLRIIHETEKMSFFSKTCIESLMNPALAAHVVQSLADNAHHLRHLFWGAGLESFYLTVARLVRKFDDLLMSVYVSDIVRTRAIISHLYHICNSLGAKIWWFVYISICEWWSTCTCYHFAYVPYQ